MSFMIKFLKSYDLRTIFLCMFIIVGLVSSRAVMSIGVIAMFVNLIIEGNYKKTVIGFYKNKTMFSISLLFFASLISLVISQDKAEGVQFVVNKLSLIVIPLAISRMEKLETKHFYFLISFFVIIVSFSALIVMFKYVVNFDIATQNLKQGISIWVPANHIRYGLILVFAFISSVYLFLKNNLFLKLKYLYLLLALLLFSVVIILAIRTALLTLFLSLLVSVFFYLFKTKNYKFFSFLIVVMFTIPIFSYKYIESVQNRINYMKYDWEQYFEGKIGKNSDSKRMISYEVGLALAKESFPFGFGAGTTKKRINEYYKINFPKIAIEDRIIPHNQFLYTLIDYGIIGFLAVCISMFYPIFTLKRKSDNLLFILFWILVFVPLLFDVSLEMQIGIVFFALFSSLILKKNSENNYL